MSSTRNSIRAFFASAVVLGFALGSHARAQAWTQLAPGGAPPDVRTLHTAVLSPNNRMIVFGGLNGPGSVTTHPMFNDVWVLANADGSSGAPAWTQLAPTGGLPSARGYHTAVHDAANNRMIVFAGDPNIGFCNGATNDVWVLANADGTGGTPSWTALNPTGGPPEMRQGTRAVYDAASNRMIAFGGATNACQPANDREVWVLANANGLGGPPAWARLDPQGTLPPARGHHILAYDPASNRMIVFGGSIATGDSNDAWVLENANGLGGTPRWTQLSPSGTPPTPRSLAAAGYDPASNRMVVFGGSTPGGRVNEVWVLQNANGLGGTPSWSRLNPAGTPPTPRDTHTAVVNAATNRLVVFAGRTCTSCTGPDFVALNDTWMLTAATGTATAPTQNFVVFDDAARNGFDPAFSFGGGADFTHATTVYAGTTSIAYTGNASFNAVAFARAGPPDLLTSQYHTLRFFVHGGTAGGQQLRLYVKRDAETGDTLIVEGELDRYIDGGAIVAGQWREVRVPLAAFGVTGGFDRIDIQTDAGAQPVLYLDQIELVAEPTLTVATATVPQGATSVQVPVTFLSGNVATVGFDFALTFVRGAAVAASGTVAQTAGPLPGATPQCGGSATTSATGNGLAGIANSPNLTPLGSGTVCTFTFPIDPLAPVGRYPFSIGPTPPTFSDPMANSIPGTLLPGAIVIAAGTAPALSYTPAPPTQIDLPGGAVGTAVQTSINVQSIGGTGAGRVQLACSAGAPFVLPAGNAFLIGAGDPPVQLTVGCTLAGAGTTANLSCSETDQPGGTTRTRTWPLACPAGSAARITAGSVTGNRGGPVATSVGFIGDGVVHSMAGNLVFDRARLTPTQIAATNGGTCFLRPPPNDDRIAFSAPPGPAPLPAQETSYCNVVFLLAENAPIGSSPLTLAATTCLDASNAPVTCLTTDGSVVTSAFDSSPLPGGALSLVAAAGQSSVSGSIVAGNFGGTPIDVTSCTPEPATGFSIQPGGAFSIPAFRLRTITVGCTAPGAGLPPHVSDLSCLLQDTNPARVVRYRLVCSTASSQGTLPGASLTGAGAAAGDEVGTAVATTVAANGDEIMVVGAPFAGADDGGRAFVIVRPASEPLAGASAKRGDAALVRDDFDLATAHVLSATTALGDKFGNAVAINAAGDRIAVGAPSAGGGGAGQVLVYVRPAGGWGPLDIPAVTINAPTGAAAENITVDDFGAQVAFTDGNMLVVGAPLSNVGGSAPAAGAAFAYAPDSNAPAAIIRPPVTETGAGFGGAIASNGTALAIAAPFQNVGGNADQGAVHVISAPGAPPEPTRMVTAAAGGIGDKFGGSVAFVGRTLVVGAPQDNTAAGTDAGSATVYSGDTSGGFVERMTLTPAGDPSQQAGAAVATNGDVVLLGAPFAIVDGRAAQGRVYAFDLPESLVAPAPAGTALDSAVGQSGDRFGAALATSARRLLIGAPKDDNELGIGGTAVQVDEGRADPFLLDRISRSGFE